MSNKTSTTKTSTADKLAQDRDKLVADLKLLVEDAKHFTISDDGIVVIPKSYEFAQSVAQGSELVDARR